MSHDVTNQGTRASETPIAAMQRVQVLVPDEIPRCMLSVHEYIEYIEYMSTQTFITIIVIIMHKYIMHRSCMFYL